MCIQVKNKEKKQTIMFVHTHNYMSNYTHLCNRFLLNKICLCCFLDIHLSSNNLSTIARISQLILSELLPDFFSCNNSVSFLHISSGSDDKKVLFLEHVWHKPLNLGT